MANAAQVTFSPGPLRAKGEASAELAAARAQLLDAQKQVLLNYGDRGLAEALLGKYTPARKVKRNQPIGRRGKGKPLQWTGPNAEVEIAAQGDPFVATVSDDPNTGVSQLARIAHDYNEGVDKLESGRFGSSLFYSGARAKALTDLSRGRQLDEFDAAQRVQSQLVDLLRTYLGNVGQQAQTQANALFGGYNDSIQRYFGMI